MSKNSNLEDDEIDLHEIFAALWAHKIFIAFLTGLSIFLAGYYSLTVEKKFTARAVFQIEQESKSGFNISGELGALASLAGFSGGGGKSNSKALLEQVSGREFILDVSKNSNLQDDPYFNTYNPNHKDPLWKATIKRIIGWQKTKAEKSNNREQHNKELQKQCEFFRNRGRSNYNSCNPFKSSKSLCICEYIHGRNTKFSGRRKHCGSKSSS